MRDMITKNWGPDEFDEMRRRMVEEQLRSRGIRDERVLEAMRRVPRHVFVPAEQHAAAYEDSALPVMEGQTISQPYVVAVMAEALQVLPEHSVLEVGTGSGYHTAVLALLARDVFTIERVQALSEYAQRRLQTLAFPNVVFRVGDGTLGWPTDEGITAETDRPRQGFDRILVAAAARDVPAPLLAQLKDGGRLVLPLGDAESQTMTVVTRKGEEVKREALGNGYRFVPLVGQYGLSPSNANPAN